MCSCTIKFNVFDLFAYIHGAIYLSFPAFAFINFCWLFFWRRVCPLIRLKKETKKQFKVVYIWFYCRRKYVFCRGIKQLLLFPYFDTLAVKEAWNWVRWKHNWSQDWTSREDRCTWGHLLDTRRQYLEVQLPGGNNKITRFKQLDWCCPSPGLSHLDKTTKTIPSHNIRTKVNNNSIV